MRKSLTGALAAAVTFGLAGGTIAHAQTDGVVFEARTSPADAGTKRKPKNTTFNVNLKVDRPGTTVEFIDLALPKGLKLSGKGLGNCTVDDLAFEGPQACASSKAGPQGKATALLGANNQLLTFTIQPFVQDASTLLFYVASEAGAGVAVQSPITGKITARGRKLRIAIPLELRQPVPGVDASLTGIDQDFTAKKGKRYLVSSTGCKRGRHALSARLTFTRRADAAPVPPPVSAAARARCSR